MSSETSIPAQGPAARLLAALFLGALLTASLAQSSSASFAGTTDRATSALNRSHAFLAGNYVEVGVRPNGAFGSTAADVPSGFHQQGGKGIGFVAIRDRSQPSWAAALSAGQVDGDFFLPGTEYEGWALRVGSDLLLHNTHSRTGVLGSNSAPVSSGGAQVSTWTSTGSHGGISVTAVHSVPDLGQQLDITVTLTNTTGSAISDLYYGRGVDPDNDRAASVFVSTNTVVAQHASDGYALVTAAFDNGGQIALFSDDPRAIAARETSGFNTTFDPAVVHAAGSDGAFRTDVGSTGTADAGMNLVFRIDSLAGGASTTLTYSYLLTTEAVSAAVGIPKLTTAAATSISTDGATLGGTVTDPGGADAVVLERGVLLATSPGPVRGASGVLEILGPATDTFATVATDLAPGTQYYARAFATNSSGVGYGPEVAFTTLRLDQTLTFAAPADRPFSTVPFFLSATATSGLTPTFGSDTPGICTVSGTAVTMLSSGTCTVRASQIGDATYEPAPPLARSFDITRAAQTITFLQPDPRTYGDTPVTLSSATTAVGLTPTLASTDGDVCAISGLTLTIVGAGDCTLTATQAGDHRYLPAEAVVRILEVARRPLSLSGARVYDGTLDVPLGVLALDGRVGLETLVLGGAAAVTDPAAAIDVPLDVTAVTLADGTDGGLASNYTLTGGTHRVSITARPVRGVFTTAGRVYDGTTDVDSGLITSRTLEPVPGTLASGVVTGETVTLSGGTATFASAAADESTPTTVSLSGATLGGVDAANYLLESVAGSTATITRRTLVVSGAFTVADRVYDGTSDAALATDELALVNTIPGDVVALAPVAAFEAASAASDVTVRLIGTSGLVGTAASNYRLDLTGSPTASAAILARPLSIASGTFDVTDKVYDGTPDATVPSHTLVLTGFATGDTGSDLTWTPTARFATVTAGPARTVELVGGAVFGGTKSGDYVLELTGAPTATAAITPRPVTVTGASAAARPYDGTTAVTISGATLADTVAGDAVTLTDLATGTAASRDAGTRAVTTTMALAGTDAANYRLVGQPALTVTITPLPVSVAMNALPSRPYDGTTVLTLAPGAFTVSGTLAGETIAVSGAAQLSSRAAGTRTVTLATPTFTPGGGTVLANYTLPSSVSGTVTVTPLNVRVTGAAVTQRAWDGSTTATVTGASLDGVRAGDAVSLAGAGAGVFASSQPGTHTVAYSPTLVGVDASNYRLNVPPLTGTITRASATLRITGGLTQIVDGSARPVRVAVLPATAGRIVVSYPGGAAPSAPGTYPVTVRLESTTHEASPVQATLTLQALESLLFPTSITVAGTSGGATAGTTTEPSGSDDSAVRAARMEQLMARVAVRPDGTLALPEIGPVLEPDGTAPALSPRDHRVLEDGEPSTARVIVVDQQRVRIERDDSGGSGFSIDLQAASGDESRTALPVDADGTLLLDRGGFVEVGGSGFLPGSTAEVWMFSTATFLGTAIVNPDGTFDGAFPVDELLESGDHTIQHNGIGADTQVRSSSLGVRIDDPDASSRERIVLVTDSGRLVAGVSGWLLLLVGIAVGAAAAWWLLGGRRRREE